MVTGNKADRVHFQEVLVIKPSALDFNWVKSPNTYPQVSSLQCMC